MSRSAPDIRTRSYVYSLRAIKLYQALQQRRDGAGWVLGKQYLRAATSIGANVEEAQSAESRLDFVHKYGIAQKEARESLYWLKLLAESDIISVPRLKPLMRETEELFAVITGIIVSTKRGSLKGKG
jgi:four helix bundle protein